MTSPFDQDDEPTAVFVPTWDDDDDGGGGATQEHDVLVEVPDDADAGAPPIVDEQPGAVIDEEPIIVDEEPVIVDEEPEADEPAPDEPTVGAPIVVPPVLARDETGPGTLRPVVPEPVVEARLSEPAPPPRSPATGRKAVEGMRAVVGLLVLIVGAGVGLAAAIGLFVLGIAFALQRLVGGG